MDFTEFAKTIGITGHVISIIKTNDCELTKDLKGGCTLASLNRVLKGETICIAKDSGPCRGGNAGFGFVDGLPEIPGGIGHFLSCGRGEGYPKGEQIKVSVEVGEQMISNQPTKVMEGSSKICLKPYEDADEPDTVTILADPDQLATLIHIFGFERSEYDNVIAPMTSGCASIFRIPFAEAMKEKPRAVIGNVDVFSRPHFDKNTFFFTVPGKEFKKMISNASKSVITAHTWNGIKKRM